SVAAAPVALTPSPASASSAMLFSVAITADACSTPGNRESKADSCIRDTESRYSFGTTLNAMDIEVDLVDAGAVAHERGLHAEQKSRQCVGATGMSDVSDALRGRPCTVAIVHRDRNRQIGQCLTEFAFERIDQKLTADRVAG